MVLSDTMEGCDEGLLSDSIEALVAEDLRVANRGWTRRGLTSSIKPSAPRRAGDATLCGEQLFLPVPD